MPVRGRTRLRSGVWLATAYLVMCATSSASAQGNRTQGGTLYLSECERCHQEPQKVTVFHGGIDLQTFLAEQHYASTPETAATIAAYLQGLLPRRKPQQTQGRTKTAPQTSADATPAQPKLLPPLFLPR